MQTYATLRVPARFACKRVYATLCFGCGVVLALASPVLAEPLVVLDPGHGGIKPGARTKEGIAEKAIVLEVAKHAKAILARAGVRVVMTRAGDQHVALAARVEMANRIGADAFVSIHANFTPVDTRRGCETYILSAQASDEVEAALIDLENEGEEGRAPHPEEFGGGIGAGANPDVALIVADLRRAGSHAASARLAKAVQEEMGGVRALGPDRGLRQAPFLVLKGAWMPAVLAEIGYLSHGAQGDTLAKPWAQKEAGEAIARGVIGFLREQRAYREN